MYLGIIMQLRDNFYYIFWTVIAIGLAFGMYFIVKKAFKDAIREINEEEEKAIQKRKELHNEK